MEQHGQPAAVYNSGSTVQVTGVSGAAVFGNFVLWVCADQNSNFLIDRNLTMASLSVIDTHMGALDLAVTAPCQLTVMGDATVAGGILRLSSRTSPGRLRVDGDFIQTGGALDLLGGSQLQPLNSPLQTGSAAAVASSSGIGQIAFIGAADANFEIAGLAASDISVLAEKNTPAAQVSFIGLNSVTIASLNIKVDILKLDASFPQSLHVSGLMQV